MKIIEKPSEVIKQIELEHTGDIVFEQLKEYLKETRTLTSCNCPCCNSSNVGINKIAPALHAETTTVRSGNYLYDLVKYRLTCNDCGAIFMTDIADIRQCPPEDRYKGLGLAIVTPLFIAAFVDVVIFCGLHYAFGIFSSPIPYIAVVILAIISVIVIILLRNLFIKQYKEVSENKVEQIKKEIDNMTKYMKIKKDNSCIIFL